MKKILLMLPALLFLLINMTFYSEAADKTVQQLVTEAKAAIKEVSVEEVKKALDAKESVTLLDVTDKQEFEAGHIPGAINISRGTLEFKVAMTVPDKNSRIIVYCGIDLRAPLATKTLNELGYKNAVNMSGGLKAWKAAGYSMAP
jgi:phage shock protein E